MYGIAIPAHKWGINDEELDDELDYELDDFSIPLANVNTMKLTINVCNRECLGMVGNAVRDWTT